MFPTLPMRHLAIAAGIGALMVAAAPAMAADLTMGFSSEPQSIDPLFSRTGPNQTTAGHIFGRLMERDEKGIFQPSLAESCTANADITVWTCKLRSGVTFHNGATLDANDVVLSYAVQWDAAHPLHIGKETSGLFEYWTYLFAAFLNPPAAG